MKHKILRLVIVLLLGAYFFARSNPTDPSVIKVNTFFGREQENVLTGATDVDESIPVDTGKTTTPEVPIEEDQTPVMCTMDYTPVCAKVAIQCVTTPCDPVEQTFSNRCVMNKNKLAVFLYDGECSK